MLPELTASALHTRLAAGEAMQLVDVREEMEFAYCQVPGSIHIPLGDVPRRATEINTTGPVVLICHHGVRSAQALSYLRHRLGYQNLLNLKGGIDAWSRDVDPSVATY